MLLEPGNRLFVSQRRLYEKDEPRFFVGEVVAYEQGYVKICGFSFVKDLTTGNMIRKNEARVKIISLDSYGFLVYQLPDHIDIKSVALENRDGQVFLSDEHGLHMNMAEYPRQGQF